MSLRKKTLKVMRRVLDTSGLMLNEYVNRLRNMHTRSTIVLFGSRARGTSLPYSDYDIMFIIDKVDEKVSTIEEIVRLKPHLLPVDVVVISVKELSDPLVRKMLEEGCQILYDGLGISKTKLSMCKRKGLS